MRKAHHVILVLTALTTALTTACHAVPTECTFSKIQAILKQSWSSASPDLRTVSFTYEVGELGKSPIMRADVQGDFAGWQGSIPRMNRTRLTAHPGAQVSAIGIQNGEVFIFNDEKAWDLPPGKKAVELTGDFCGIWDYLIGTFQLRLDYRPYEQLGSETFNGKPGPGKLMGKKTIGNVEYSMYDFQLSEPVDEAAFPSNKQDARLVCSTYRVFLDPIADVIVKVQLLNKQKVMFAESWGEQIQTVRPGVKAPTVIFIKWLIQDKRFPQPTQRLEYQIVDGRLLPKEYRQILGARTAYMRFSDFKVNPVLPASAFTSAD